jgi:hypothetical protein
MTATASKRYASEVQRGTMPFLWFGTCEEITEKSSGAHTRLFRATLALQLLLLPFLPATMDLGVIALEGRGNRAA